MISMHLHLALIVALVAPPRSLSPEAGEHNTTAMRFYDAGEYAPAVDEFYAAYRAMPDARRDREGRQLLLGSMHMTLLNLHDQTGEAAPLCRLQGILQEHADALAAAFPEEPEMLEIANARARHEAVTQKLAAYGDNPCAPPPPPPAPAPAPVVPAATIPVQPAPAPAAAPTTATPASSDAIPPRHLKIAGGITLGLSAALLGVMTYGLVSDAKMRARVSEIDDKPPDCPLSPGEHEELLGLRKDAVTSRGIAIGTGVAAGVTTALGVTLFALARRGTGKKRWSAAPWWSPSGAGLTLRVQLGAAR